MLLFCSFMELNLLKTLAILNRFASLMSSEKSIKKSSIIISLLFILSYHFAFIFVLKQSFFLLNKPIRQDPTPGLDNFLQHSIDIELTADFNVGDLVALLDVKSEPVNYQQTLYHVTVHADFGVYFVIFFECFPDDHREDGQQWS